MAGRLHHHGLRGGQRHYDPAVPGHQGRHRLRAAASGRSLRLQLPDACHACRNVHRCRPWGADGGHVPQAPHQGTLRETHHHLHVCPGHPGAGLQPGSIRGRRRRDTGKLRSARSCRQDHLLRGGRRRGVLRAEGPRRVRGRGGGRNHRHCGGARHRLPVPPGQQRALPEPGRHGNPGLFRHGDDGLRGILQRPPGGGRS